MMTVRLRILGLALIVAILPIAAHADGDLQKQYKDAELIKIFQDGGFRAVEQLEDRVLRIKIDGHSYTLFIYEDDDLQLYFGLSGYVVTADDMNEWNRDKRLSRAYLDEESDPILESDLLANAGYSTAQVLEWLTVFDSSARSFRRFVDENDQSK